MTPFFENSDFCLTPKNVLELSHIISKLAIGELTDMVAELSQGRERLLKSINYFNENPSRTITDNIYHLIDQHRNKKTFEPIKL
jgi:hypothetical protein